MTDLPQCSHMTLGDKVDSPRGWTAMIEKHPKERLTLPAVLNIDADTLNKLLAVRHEMSAWAYVPDPAGKDVWNPSANTSGDCEDWCMAARRNAEGKGFPREAFHIAICRNEAGADHAVLVAVTDRGDFVLDLHKPGLWNWDELPYQWIARECPRYEWRAIQKAVSLAALAERG